MLHLSLLRLAKTDRRWRNLSLYQTHQLVWKAFPEVKARPFLFHLEEHSDHYGLLVQSREPPDWACLPDVDIRLKVVDPHRVEVAQVYSFSLRANPTVLREGYEDGKRRRVAVSANADLRRQRARERGLDVARESFDHETTLLRWLARKGEQGGFDLEGPVEPGPERVCQAGPTITHHIHRTPMGGRPERRGNAPVTIHGCDFTGRLRVVDAERFGQARTDGIGRAKAFGFGLLMLMPV